MNGLLLALAALFAGPLLAGLTRRRPSALFALDGLVLVAVGGLVLFEVLPAAVERGGWPALLLAAAGFALPALAERALSGTHQRTHRVALAAALAGLLLHEAMDGAALAMAAGDAHAHSLLWAIVLHRLPLSLFLWLTIRPLFGGRFAWLALAGMAAATVVGFGAYETVAPAEQSLVVSLLLAAVAGALLHVLVHQVRPDGDPPRAALAGAVGGAAALFLVFHEETADTASLALAVLSGISMPWAVVFGLWLPVALAGIGSSWLTTLAPRRLPALADGLHLALRNPVCSCGTLPVYEDAIGHGESRRKALVFLLASPILSLEAVALALWLLPWPFAVLWLSGGIFSAVVIAALFGPRLTVYPERARLSGEDGAHEAAPPAGAPLASAARYWFRDWLDHYAAWTACGAALLLLLSGPNGPLRLPGGFWFTLVWLGLAAVPLHLSAVAAVAVVFLLYVEWAVPAPALLLLLLLAPATGLAMRRTLLRLHGGTWVILLTAAQIALAAGWALAAGPLLPSLWQDFSLQDGRLHLGWIPRWPPALAAAAAAGSGLLLVVSFLRCGPRGWLAEILPPVGHEHAHHPGAPHDHGPRARVQIDAAAAPGAD